MTLHLFSHANTTQHPSCIGHTEYWLRKYHACRHHNSSTQLAFRFTQWIQHILQSLQHILPTHFIWLVPLLVHTGFCQSIWPVFCCPTNCPSQETQVLQSFAYQSVLTLLHSCSTTVNNSYKHLESCQVMFHLSHIHLLASMTNEHRLISIVRHFATSTFKRCSHTLALSLFTETQFWNPRYQPIRFQTNNLFTS